MKKTIITILLMMSLQMNSMAHAMDNHHINEANIILYRENVDLDAKSVKGWLRVFNSESKMSKYTIYVDDTEKELIINYLKFLYRSEENKYSKKVR